MYYLLDLERSILTGRITYWKANKFGYTDNIYEAGLYTEEVAIYLKNSDLDNRTVPVSINVVNNILRK